MKRVIPPALNILALGIGTQSTTLYYMSALGIIKPYDHAIFVDPGREKKETYKYLKMLIEWGKKNNGPPIIVYYENNLYKNLLNCTNSSGNGFISIPAYVTGRKNKSALLTRQCTNEYKIQPFTRAIRKIYNVTGHYWTPPTTISFGITVDEIQRMKIPRKKWQTSLFPFCGYSVTRDKTKKIKGLPKFKRQDCIDWLIENNFEVPVKSSCTFCPFQSDASWQEMKNNDPEEFKAMVNLDKTIRKDHRSIIKTPIYLHRSLKPLDRVVFKTSDKDDFSSCSAGICGL